MLTEDEYFALFDAFRFYTEFIRDDSPEFQAFFVNSRDFFRRLREPEYRMSIPEIHTSLMVLELYAAKHPLDCSAHMALHSKLLRH